MSVELRAEVAPSHDPAWPQISLADQSLMEVEQTLREMSGIVESARMTISDSRAETATLGQRYTNLVNAYNEECHARLECAQAYAGLFAQHQATVKTVQAMDDKCQVLDRELRVAREAAKCHGSEVSGGQQACTEEAPSNKHADWDMLEHEIEKARLEARVQALEDEKLEMTEKHQLELANAADHIQDVTRRICELEKMRDAAQIQLSTSGQDGHDTNNKANLGNQSGHGNRSRKRRQTIKLKNGAVKQQV